MRSSALGAALAASLALVVATVAIVAWPETPTEVDPLNCSTYPEKRLWMENQAWVEPQPSVPLGHPSAGKQGHIHVGMCFPLNQTLTGSSGTVAFDLFIQLHNVTGRAFRLRTIPYLNGGPPPPIITPLDWSCQVADCNRWIHVDFPLSLPIYSGWTELGFWLDVELPNGQSNVENRRWYNLNRWFVNFQNGKPPLPPANAQVVYIGGGSWLPQPVTGGSNYSNAKIKDMTQFPWDPATGQAIPVSGVWKPNVTFQPTVGSDVRSGKALVDPVLHAMPPSEGVVVYDGPAGDKTLSIDTTLLTDGPHRLLLINCTRHATGIKQCGVLVVPFVVANARPS